MAEERTVRLTLPGEGPAFWLVTDRVTIKATGEDTNGAFALAESETPPGGGPPAHVHHREDELFAILEGEFEFLAGDHTIRASKGAFVYAPRLIPHAFKNVGPGTGRMLVTATPAGFERFVMEAGTSVEESPLPPTGPPDVARLVEIGARYGIEFL
jgi:quercetin dioxygenase-like cupin family protein